MIRNSKSLLSKLLAHGVLAGSSRSRLRDLAFTSQLVRAMRLLGPTLFALSFAGVAHAQGTMDFSGAQTLVGTFKTFAVYAGAVICFGGLVFAGIRSSVAGSQMPFQGFLVRCLAPECSAGVRAG